ncbi:MAG: glycosyltransferase family 4 protein [Lachnospiraceae bacterium]
MKVVIDCFKLVKGNGKSIGIYNLTHNLVRELAGENQGGEQQIIILGNKYNRKDFDLPGLIFIEIKANPFSTLRCLWWELFEVSVVAKKLRADKVLFPRGFASMLHLTKEFVIIHDMIPFYYHENYPDYFGKLRNGYIMRRLVASAKTADGVITVSESSKRDIMKYAKVDESKIKVIYNGCNCMPEINSEDEGEAYIIAMTSDLPHKNAVGIIKAYREYCQLTDVPLSLKIIGIADVKKFDLPLTEPKGKIECIQYVEKDEELYSMIHNAKVFVFLSLIEGFGFPPVEALQLGTPVVCSDRSSLPEVLGNAAVLVNPEDEKAVAQAIYRVLQEKRDSGSVAAEGKRYVERFSWNKIGKQYWNTLMNEEK